MFGLILQLALGIFGSFIRRAEEREAWRKAVARRIRELDEAGNDSAKVRDAWAIIEKELRDGKIGHN